jgi:hypothetical protein
MAPKVPEPSRRCNGPPQNASFGFRNKTNFPLALEIFFNILRPSVRAEPTGIRISLEDDVPALPVFVQNSRALNSGLLPIMLAVTAASKRTRLNQNEDSG